MIQCPSCEETFIVDFFNERNVREFRKKLRFCPFCGLEVDGEADAVSVNSCLRGTELTRREMLETNPRVHIFSIMDGHFQLKFAMTVEQGHSVSQHPLRALMSDEEWCKLRQHVQWCKVSCPIGLELENAHELHSLDAVDEGWKPQLNSG